MNTDIFLLIRSQFINKAHSLALFSYSVSD